MGLKMSKYKVIDEAFNGIESILKNILFLSWMILLDIQHQSRIVAFINSLCPLWLGCSVFYFHLHIEVLCLEVSSLTHTLIGPNRRKSYLRTGSPR